MDGAVRDTTRRIPAPTTTTTGHPTLSAIVSVQTSDRKEVEATGTVRHPQELPLDRISSFSLIARDWVPQLQRYLSLQDNHTRTDSTPIQALTFPTLLAALDLESKIAQGKFVSKKEKKNVFKIYLSKLSFIPGTFLLYDIRRIIRARYAKNGNIAAEVDGYAEELIQHGFVTPEQLPIRTYDTLMRLLTPAAGQGNQQRLTSFLINDLPLWVSKGDRDPATGYTVESSMILYGHTPELRPVGMFNPVIDAHTALIPGNWTTVALQLLGTLPVETSTISNGFTLAGVDAAFWKWTGHQFGAILDVSPNIHVIFVPFDIRKIMRYVLLKQLKLACPDNVVDGNVLFETQETPPRQYYVEEEQELGYIYPTDLSVVNSFVGAVIDPQFGNVWELQGSIGQLTVCGFKPWPSSSVPKSLSQIYRIYCTKEGKAEQERIFNNCLQENNIHAGDTLLCPTFQPYYQSELFDHRLRTELPSRPTTPAVEHDWIGVRPFLRRVGPNQQAAQPTLQDIYGYAVKTDQ